MKQSYTFDELYIQETHRISEELKHVANFNTEVASSIYLIENSNIDRITLFCTLLVFMTYETGWNIGDKYERYVRHFKIKNTGAFRQLQSFIQEFEQYYDYSRLDKLKTWVYDTIYRNHMYMINYIWNDGTSAPVEYVPRDILSKIVHDNYIDMIHFTDMLIRVSEENNS